MDLKISGNYLSGTVNNIQNNKKNRQIAQTFTSKDIKEDRKNNGKFDVSEAVNNFGKGLCSPITALIKHPVAAIGMVGATAVACSLVPVLGPILAVGFGAIGIYEIGKSGYKIAKDFKNGEYDQAEKDFNGLGQGTINTYLTILGLRGSARIAKEAKLMETLKTNKLTQTQKLDIAEDVGLMTKKEATKELLSLLTTKEGRKAAFSQFKKENITERAKDIKNFIFKKEVKEKEIIEKEFTKTPEGIKRANMTTEEISQEVNKLAKEAFDEYKIPEELLPQIEITKANMEQGGGYRIYGHKIEVNENSYREGAFDLPNVIKHEATHAREALIRDTLSYTKREQLTKEYLLNKIMSGDNNTVIKDVDIFGFSTINPPKMPPQMRTDFAELAQKHIFQIGSKGIEKQKMSKLVEPLIDKYPEFIQEYKNRSEALELLTDYGMSHQLRYKIGTTNSLNLSTEQIAKLGKINEEEAITSFKNHLECQDGNASNNTFGSKIGLGGDFDQYQFGTEEVLAQKMGNEFEIAHLEKELEVLRKMPNFDRARENYLLTEIDKAKSTIIYKTKGREYYNLFMEAKNNPENKELAKQVKIMELKLNKLKDKIKLKKDYINGKEKIIVQIEGEQFVMKRAKGGATIFIPYNTTTTADILAS